MKDMFILRIQEESTDSSIPWLGPEEQHCRTEVWMIGAQIGCRELAWSGEVRGASAGTDRAMSPQCCGQSWCPLSATPVPLVAITHSTRLFCAVTNLLLQHPLFKTALAEVLGVLSNFN